MQYCSKCDVRFINYNTHPKSEHRKKRINFLFTENLNLIKPYADDIHVENSISSFETNDVIVYYKNEKIKDKNDGTYCEKTDKINTLISKGKKIPT